MGTDSRPRPLEVAMELAGGQHGVVARRQLLDAGLSERSIDWLLSRGYLRPAHRGIYHVGSVVGPRAREVAAVLACGDGAVVSHRSAGWLWSIVVELGAAPVDVSVPGRDRSGRNGIRARRVETLLPEDVTVLDSVPVTTPARTIFDLAGELKRRELEQALARAERNRLLVRADLRRLLARHPRRRGTRVLRRVLASGRPPVFTRSEAEERFLTLVRERGLPEPRGNVRLLGFEVDFYWPEARLVVEIDGFAYHGIPAAFERDRHRDSRLVAAGFRVMRVTWNRLTTRPTLLADQMARALAHG